MILGTGFFVAAEFAFVAVDRSRIERETAEGSRRARRVQAILRRLSFQLSGAQLGITVTSLALGFIAEPAVAEVLRGPVERVVGTGSARGVSVGLALALVTISSMVLSELVPKNIAVARPVRTAKALAPPTLVYSFVFGPLIRFLNGAANWTVRKLGIEPEEELTAVRSLEELDLLIRASGEEGTIDPGALTLLTRSIRFSHKTAADALIPRTQVDALPANTTVPDLVRAAMETGFSRFPVVGNDLDDVVGVVHVKDAFRLPPAERLAAPITAITSEPLYVPETRDLGSLLAELREVGSHLAVVVDEFGGTAGIITLEDILEEIVGSIDDEYDAGPDNLTTASPAGTLVLDGTLHVDEVREATGFEMPEGDYETIAGFVVDQLGRIPEVGDAFGYEGWRFEVVEMDRRRVANVKVAAPQPAARTEHP